MGAGRAARLLLHVTAIVILLTAIGFTIAAFMSTGWQVYKDPGTGEIHQHGLWLDYFFDVQHVASKGKYPEWIPKTKFGDAVQGDEAHRAKAVHINTLILLCVATVLAIAGCICACCAAASRYAGAGWVATVFLATLLSTSAVIMFYIEQLSHRYVTTDKKLQQKVGYSFWFALAGAALFAISILFAISYIVFTIISKRRDERFHGDTRPKTLSSRHITSLSKDSFDLSPSSTAL